MLTGALKRVVPKRWWPAPYLAALVYRKTGGRVRSGPFQGMRYVREAHGSVLIPKLLGIYERELWPIVEQLVALDLDTVFVLGAAEGYYAVGLASRRPGGKVIAYESGGAARAALEALGVLNGVSDRIVVRAEATPDRLRADMQRAGRAAILCDVEGAEWDLMHPRLNRFLLHAYLLIEVHEFACPGVAAELMARFAGTHHIERIWEDGRSARDLPFHTPYSRLLPARYKAAAVSEMRPERMSWLWLKPKRRAAADRLHDDAGAPGGGA